MAYPQQPFLWEGILVCTSLVGQICLLLVKASTPTTHAIMERSLLFFLVKVSLMHSWKGHRPSFLLLGFSLLQYQLSSVSKFYAHKISQTLAVVNPGQNTAGFIMLAFQYCMHLAFF